MMQGTLYIKYRTPMPIPESGYHTALSLPSGFHLHSSLTNNRCMGFGARAHMLCMAVTHGHDLVRGSPHADHAVMPTRLRRALKGSSTLVAMGIDASTFKLMCHHLSALHQQTQREATGEEVERGTSCTTHCRYTRHDADATHTVCNVLAQHDGIRSC